MWHAYSTYIHVTLSNDIRVNDLVTLTVTVFVAPVKQSQHVELEMLRRMKSTSLLFPRLKGPPGNRIVCSSVCL